MKSNPPFWITSKGINSVFDFLNSKCFHQLVNFTILEPLMKNVSKKYWNSTKTEYSGAYPIQDLDIFMSVILFYDFCCKNWQFNQTVFPESWLPLSSSSFYLKCTNSVWRSYIVVTSGDGKGLNVRKLDCSASGVFKISDIDECSESPPVCLPGQRCVNYAGGHYCSCRNGYRLNSTTNRCEGTCTVDPLQLFPS